MKKLILSMAIMFAMSSFSVFAQDAKKEKKKEVKTEQCCKEAAKKGDKKEACKGQCCKEEGKKATPKKEKK